MTALIITEKPHVSEIFSEAISKITNENFTISKTGNLVSESFTITHVMGSCFNEHNIIYGPEQMDSKHMKSILKERQITMAVTIDLDAPEPSHVKGENVFSIQNKKGQPFVILCSKDNINRVGALISKSKYSVLINACDPSEEGDLLFDYILRSNSLVENSSFRFTYDTIESTELDNKWRQLLRSLKYLN